MRAFHTLGWENLADPPASGTVDALLPLWFALVKQRGGNRRLVLRLAT